MARASKTTRPKAGLSSRSPRGSGETPPVPCEAAVASSEARPGGDIGPSELAQLVDACHAAIVSADRTGTITSWNRSAVELFGYSPDEALGTRVEMLVPARLRDSFVRAWQQWAASPDTAAAHRVVETHALRKDGAEVPIEVSLVTFARADSPVAVAVIRDISAHHALVQQLNDALQRLSFHIERMPLGYIVWDTSFRVAEWNPAAERLFGYRRDEAVGRHAYDLLVPGDARPTVESVWTDLLHGDESSHSINANVRKDGTRLTCEWFNTPLRDATGAVAGVASMVMDVSERDALEQQIRDKQRLESLGVMAAGIAHDFNSALTVVLGNAEMLAGMRQLPPRAREHVDLIADAGGRARELIKHLLTYVQTGRHNPEPTDLNEVIRTAERFIRSSIGAQHALQFDLAGSLPLIRADRSQIDQVLLNLAVNARQAMPEGGTVRITTSTCELSNAQARMLTPGGATRGRYIELVVEDHGIGMALDVARRVFDPFFTTKPTGHGLGLAAVLGALRQHHAFICVESALGAGTRMHVYFPIPVHTEPA